MHCPLTWKHMTLLLLRSWDDNGQEGHCLVMKSMSTLKGLRFLSYFVVKYIGRVTHDTVFWSFWYESTVTGEVRSTILCILNYFGLHTCIIVNVHVLTFYMSGLKLGNNFWRRFKKTMSTGIFCYSTISIHHPDLSRSSSFGWYIPGWIWICSGTTHFKNKN